MSDAAGFEFLSNLLASAPSSVTNLPNEITASVAEATAATGGIRSAAPFEATPMNEKNFLDRDHNQEASFRAESFHANAIPRATPAALRFQMLSFDQVAEVLLQGVATATGQLDGVGHGDAPMLASELDDL